MCVRICLSFFLFRAEDISRLRCTLISSPRSSVSLGYGWFLLRFTFPGSFFVDLFSCFLFFSLDFRALSSSYGLVLFPSSSLPPFLFCQLCFCLWLVSVVCVTTNGITAVRVGGGLEGHGGFDWVGCVVCMFIYIYTYIIFTWCLFVVGLL